MPCRGAGGGYCVAACLISLAQTKPTVPLGRYGSLSAAWYRQEADVDLTAWRMRKRAKMPVTAGRVLRS